MQKDLSRIPFTSYQKFVIFILAVTQFSVVLDFMIMSPMGDMLMKVLSLKTSQFGIAVSAYAFSAGALDHLPQLNADLIPALGAMGIGVPHSGQRSELARRS